MLQDMGLNRNACTGYLALAEAHNSQHNPSNIAAINADLSRLKAPNGLHHYVQSSKLPEMKSRQIVTTLLVDDDDDDDDVLCRPTQCGC